jgi:hypothetical protein
VAVDNKKLKPFWMQFQKDEAKEARNPKSEPVRLREAGSRECDEPELRLEPLNWPTSGFGLRISFGFRASGFELWP